MKKFVTPAVALVALLAFAPVAGAQTAPEPLNIQTTAKVTPNKGGSKKKLKNATLNLAFTVNQGSRKTVSTITYFVPKNVKLSGKGFRYCPYTKINADGESSCPKGSKVGTGTATAVLGPNFVPLNFNVGVYAGSKNELALALAQTGGGAVVTAFQAPITSAGTPFGQKITVNVPASVQSPATGLYSYITSVNTTIGAKVTKKVKKKVKGSKKKKTVKVPYYFSSLSGCPADGSHHAGVRLTYVQNDAGPGGTSDISQATSDCKK